MADTPATPSAAVVNELFLIDLNGAQDVTNVTGPKADLSSYAVNKVLFLDIVAKLTAAPANINPLLISSKIEGVPFGQDVVINGVTKHTLYVTNDNDFLGTIANPLAPTSGNVANPNQLYVFAFDDRDLQGYVPQPVKPRSLLECGFNP